LDPVYIKTFIDRIISSTRASINGTLS